MWSVCACETNESSDLRRASNHKGVPESTIPPLRSSTGTARRYSTERVFTVQLAKNHKYGKYYLVKTTIDLPESLLRAAKAAAALRGESMKTFVRRALEDHCRPSRKAQPAWKAVLGRADRKAVAAVDELIEAELSTIDRSTWK
jgi:hypothetical protein